MYYFGFPLYFYFKDLSLYFLTFPSIKIIFSRVDDSFFNFDLHFPSRKSFLSFSISVFFFFQKKKKKSMISYQNIHN